MDYDPDSILQRDEDLIASLCETLGEIIPSYHRAEVKGTGRIPSGPALYVGNHNAGLYSPDTFIFGAAVFRDHGIDAVPFGLAHEALMSSPHVRRLLVPIGAIRASQQNAQKVFANSQKVLVYPGGDQDALRPFSRRNQICFGGHQGYIRLALRSGVPVIPVVAAGAHSTFVVLNNMKGLARLLETKHNRLKALPLTLSFPWGLSLGTMPYIPLPTRIVIEIMEPIVFERSGEEAAADQQYVASCAHHVESKMQDCLNTLVKRRKKLGAWPSLFNFGP